jgi:hypothetical protein
VRFAYFDPDAGRYETRRSEPAALRVTGDVLPRATGQTGEGLPIGDIAGLMTQTARWVRPDPPPLHARPWPYVALLVPVVLAAGGVAYRRRERAGPSPSDPSAAALDAARARLHDAQRHLAADADRPFYRAVERGVLAFLDERLALPRSASGMTGAAIDRHLAHNGVPRSEREALRSLLATCNEAQFAPTAPPADAREATLDHARDLLRRLDDALPPDPEPA